MNLVVPVMTDRLLEISLVNGVVFKTEMHLSVYFNPCIEETRSQIDNRRQGWKLQGSVQLVPWRAPIILYIIEGQHFGVRKLGANSKMNLSRKISP